MSAYSRHFDTSREKLAGFPTRLKAAFAAGCAERQVPVYVAYAKRTRRENPQSLAAIMDSVWQAIANDNMSPRQLRSLYGQCSLLEPPEDLIDDVYVANAGYAVTTAAYAIRTLLGGESSDAVWAGKHAINSIDNFLTSAVGRQPRYHIGTSEGRRQLEDDVLLGGEYQRQQRDLSELAVAAKELVDFSDFIRQFRSLAQAEAIDFLKEAL